MIVCKVLMLLQYLFYKISLQSVTVFCNLLSVH